jgi:peptide/nickel transport system substrate-binding protein
VDNPGTAFQNKLVRQAISYAIDREAIANEIYYGEATSTDNQIPDGYMGYQGQLLRYPKNGDVAKAKRLMAQAGISGYEVEVITSDKDWLRKELELVAAMVSQIGITYKIQNMDGRLQQSVAEQAISSIIGRHHHERPRPGRHVLELSQRPDLARI